MPSVSFSVWSSAPSSTLWRPLPLVAPLTRRTVPFRVFSVFYVFRQIARNVLPVSSVSSRALGSLAQEAAGKPQSSAYRRDICSFPGTKRRARVIARKKTEANPRFLLLIPGVSTSQAYCCGYHPLQSRCSVKRYCFPTIPRVQEGVHYVRFCYPRQN